MSDVIQSDRQAAMAAMNEAARNMDADYSDFDWGALNSHFAAHRLATSADLRSNLDVAREALGQTQMMIEQIEHLKSTDFDAVRKRIIANRIALATIR